MASSSEGTPIRRTPPGRSTRQHSRSVCRVSDGSRCSKTWKLATTDTSPSSNGSGPVMSSQTSTRRTGLRSRLIQPWTYFPPQPRWTRSSGKRLFQPVQRRRRRTLARATAASPVIATARGPVRTICRSWSYSQLGSILLTLILPSPPTTRPESTRCCSILRDAHQRRRSPAAAPLRSVPRQREQVEVVVVRPERTAVQQLEVSRKQPLGDSAVAKPVDHDGRDAPLDKESLHSLQHLSFVPFHVDLDNQVRSVSNLRSFVQPKAGCPVRAGAVLRGSPNLTRLDHSEGYGRAAGVRHYQFAAPVGGGALDQRSVWIWRQVPAQQASGPTAWLYGDDAETEHLAERRHWHAVQTDVRSDVHESAAWSHQSGQ